MSIDPNIPLSVQSPKFNSPFDVLADMYKLRANQAVQQQQIQSAQALEAERRQKLADDQRKQQQATVLADAYRQSVDPQTGTVNRTTLTQILADKGLGPAIPDLLKGLDDAEEAHTKAQSAKRAFEDAEVGYAKTLGSQILASDFNPAIVNGLFEVAKSHGHDVSLYQQMYEQQPEQFKTFVQKLVQPPPPPTAFTISPGQQHYDASGKLVASVPEKPINTEQKTVLIAGKPTLVNYHPDTGKSTLPSGEDVSDKVSPVPTQAQVSIMQGNQVPAAPDIGPLDPKTANTIDPKTGLTPNAKRQSGIAFALQGVMPSMGTSNRGAMGAARSSIVNEGAALAAAAGTDLATLRAEYKANAAALSRIVPIYRQTAAAAGTADDNLALAIDQSQKVARSGVPLENTFKQWMQSGDKALSSNPELAKLQLYIYTAAREYAKVTTGAAASVQGLTDSASKKVDSLISSAQSPETFQGVIQAMQRDMHNVTGNQIKQIGQTSQTIADFLRVATGMPAPTGGGNEPAPNPGATSTPSTLPPVSERKVGVTEAVINGVKMVWAGTGWRPK